MMSRRKRTRRVDTDTFLADLFTTELDTMRVTLERHREGLKNPPMTVQAYHGHWIRSGLMTAASFL